MTKNSSTPSPQAQATLKALQKAVTNALEKKRRLGHYAVLWKGGRPILVGEDAPSSAHECRDE